jgi:hypothetical protein
MVTPFAAAARHGHFAPHFALGAGEAGEVWRDRLPV